MKSVFCLMQNGLSASDDKSGDSSDPEEQQQDGAEGDDDMDVDAGPLTGSAVIDAKNKFCACVICKAKSNQAIQVS